MNLDDFEDAIEQGVILTRGLYYYDIGSVLSLEMTSPNHYKAKVAGTHLYEVTATLDDGREVEDITCTCPYDWGSTASMRLPSSMPCVTCLMAQKGQKSL